MAEDNINLRAGEVTEWGTTLAPITKYLEPQNPIKKVDISTGNVNYIYPLTTDKQVILEDKTRLNTKITQLNAAILELNDLIAQVDQDISNAQSKAEAAQTTADSAVTKANAAQSTADNAMPKSGGTFTGEIKAMVKGSLIGPLELVEGRVNDLDVPHVPGELRNFAGKQGAVGGPPTDANVIHLAWDNDGKWDSQIAVSNSGNQLYFRSKNPNNNSEWLPWETVMPKSGGNFTGNVVASYNNHAGDCIRNIVCSDTQWIPVATNKIIGIRK